MEKKVLISDEVNEKIITMEEFLSPTEFEEEHDYPHVQLKTGERFYFNLFLFL